MTDELTKIADKMDALLQLFTYGGSLVGMILPTDKSASFRGMAMEAKSIIDDELGVANDFSMRIALRAGEGRPSPATVHDTSQFIRSAIRDIGRKRSKPNPAPLMAKPYVDPSRIATLQAMNGGAWDFKRLVELCRELNVAAANRCHMSTAMLLRTILNHVPPVLGFATFSEVANNYGGPKSNKSFKGNMQRLETSLRNIADMHLHSPIRASEDVPSAVQVDFAADLDVLLGEVIRVAGDE